jgi:hypothetical protein
MLAFYNLFLVQMKGRYCKLTHSSNKKCSVKVGGRAECAFLETPNF